MIQLVFLSELRQISTKFDSFWHTDSQDDRNMWGTLNVHLSPRPIYVNALSCKTQMLQVVTLHDKYLYQIVHLFIFNLLLKAPGDLIILCY